MSNSGVCNLCGVAWEKHGPKCYARLGAIALALLLGVAVLLGQSTPLTPGANLLVRTDAAGSLLAAAQTYTAPTGPLRNLANALVRTDANGYLLITNPSGFGGGGTWGSITGTLSSQTDLQTALDAKGPSNAQYWTGAADATLTAEKNLGALTTALVVNTGGVPSAYAGTTCTNQFVRVLSVLGVATCNTVSLTADVSGTLPPANINTETTVTTTGNIDDLSFSNASIIRMNNASDSTIRGLAPGTAGQHVTIVSVGAGNVFLAHQNIGSTAADRLINAATSANTPLAAGVGAASYTYDATTARWRLVSHTQGAWITPTYASGNFTGNTGTWTVDAGDVVASLYYLSGRQLSVLLEFDATSTTVTPNQLIVNTAAIGGFTSPAQTYLSLGHVFDAGAFAAADPFVTTAGSFIFTRLDGANFANSTNSTYCRAASTYAVN